MNVYLIIITIILHFVFDWMLQPRDIAKKKGGTPEGVEAVFVHMLINILPFTFIWGGIFIIMKYDFGDVLGISIINFVSHFIIDVMLPKGKNERQMINYTALDQILHLSILFILINLLQ